MVWDCAAEVFFWLRLSTFSHVCCLPSTCNVCQRTSSQFLMPRYHDGAPCVMRHAAGLAHVASWAHLDARDGQINCSQQGCRQDEQLPQLGGLQALHTGMRELQSCQRSTSSTQQRTALVRIGAGCLHA